MSISYTFKTIQDNLNPEDQRITGYYPRVVSSGTIDKKMMFNAIAQGSAPLRADLERTWSLMEDFIINKLQDGFTINLDHFGKFSITAESRLVQSPNEIRAESIRVKSLTFRASQVANKKLKRAEFERKPKKN